MGSIHMKLFKFRTSVSGTLGGKVSRIWQKSEPDVYTMEGKDTQRG